MNISLLLLFAILVYQILFAIAARNEKAKVFKTIYIINIPLIILNVVTICNIF